MAQGAPVRDHEGASDPDLLDALRRADVAALHELYRRYGGVVHRTALLLGRRAAKDPDDLTVAAFVSLFHQPAPAGRSARSELLRRVARAASPPRVPVPLDASSPARAAMT